MSVYQEVLDKLGYIMHISPDDLKPGDVVDATLASTNEDCKLVVIGPLPLDEAREYCKLTDTPMRVLEVDLIGGKLYKVTAE